MVGSMDTIIQDMNDAIRELSLAEGGSASGIPSVTVWHFTGDRVQMPQTGDPYLYIVLDGALRLYTPSGIVDCMQGQYAISKIDTPLSGTVLAFSDRRDLLALSVVFAVHDIITAVLGLDDDLIQKILNGHLDMEDMALSDEAVIQSVHRLFSAMKTPVRSEFLRKAILQEVIYYVLCVSRGKQLLQSIADVGQADDIYQANSWIKENFRHPFTVEELAEQRNMSVSLPSEIQARCWDGAAAMSEASASHRSQAADAG